MTQKKENSEIRCNKCMWTGKEDELVRCKEEGKYGDGYGFKGCPNCKTDWALMDTKNAVEVGK